MKSIRSFAPLILAILSITMAVYQFSRIIIYNGWTNSSSAMVANWDERIQPLRQFLPPGTTLVGYLDKSMIDKKTAVFDGEEFFLMQYSIAPVVLKLGAKQAWIVGNFDRDTKFRPWLNIRLKNYEVQSFGAGLYLIHNLDK